jgi:Glycosyl transferase family 2
VSRICDAGPPRFGGLYAVAVSAWPGVLAMTMVVRDEQDIVAANLDYHLAQGVDVILVTDHSSTDRTPEILAEYAQNERVHVDRDEGEAHDQVSRVNRLTRIADESHGADWIIHCDADEFWMPALGSLRDVFASIPDRFGYIRVQRTNFVPLADDGRPFSERMVVRERRSLNLRGDPLEPKVAQRPEAAEGVLPGNHDLENPVMELAPDIGALEIGHFPIRSFEQFERKVVNTGTGYERLPSREDGVGADQLELLRRQRAGELREHYGSQLLQGERLERALAAGDVVTDERVRAGLTGRGAGPVESADLRRFLHEMWLRAGSLNDARLAAEEHAREQGARAVQLNDELMRLAATLAEVRESRIMRSTAGARRLYYRLRGGPRPPRR